MRLTDLSRATAVHKDMVTSRLFAATLSCSLVFPTASRHTAAAPCGQAVGHDPIGGFLRVPTGHLSAWNSAIWGSIINLAGRDLTGCMRGLSVVSSSDRPLTSRSHAGGGQAPWSLCPRTRPRDRSHLGKLAFGWRNFCDFNLFWRELLEHG